MKNQPTTHQRSDSNPPKKPLRVRFMDVWKAIEELVTKDPSLGEEPQPTKEEVVAE